MNNEILFKTIVAPIVTEKSTKIADRNKQIAFEVATSADKLTIKKAVEFLFNLKVDSVTVCNQKGKRRKFGNIEGRRKDHKKAYVKLSKNFDIDFTNKAEG